MPSLLGLGRSKEEKIAKQKQDAALASQSDLARQLTKTGGERYALTQPVYGRALDHYSALLSGDRAKMSQATQPDVRRINDVYRGAEGSIMKRLTGASRDVAVGDLARQRAGQIAEVTGVPRLEAARTLLGEGRAGSNDFMSSLSGGANIYGNNASGYGMQAMTEQQRKAATLKMFSQLGGGTWSVLKKFPQLLKMLGGSGGGTNTGPSASGAPTGTPWDNII